MGIFKCYIQHSLHGDFSAYTHSRVIWMNFYGNHVSSFKPLHCVYNQPYQDNQKSCKQSPVICQYAYHGSRPKRKKSPKKNWICSRFFPAHAGMLLALFTSVYFIISLNFSNPQLYWIRADPGSDQSNLFCHPCMISENFVEIDTVPVVTDSVDSPHATTLSSIRMDDNQKSVPRT